MIANEITGASVQAGDGLQTLVDHVRKCVGDPALPANVVLLGLLHAIEAAGEPGDALAWLYRVLRLASENCRRAGERSEDLFADPVAADEEQRFVGQWFRATLPLLNSDAGELLERVDLGGECITEVAVALQVPANSVGIRLQRARRELRRHVEQTCTIQTEELLC